MPPLIDGTRIGALIKQAADDIDLRVRLFHCPEKVIAGMDLTDEEARALRMGDLSRVDLDDETLAQGRRLFSELPALDEGANQVAASYLSEFRTDRVRELCT
jgi:hypothetical protein